MGFTKHALDLFISEKISLVTLCGASDVSAEFPHSKAWVSAFVLSTIFNDQPPAQYRQLALQFVRRVEMAFAEYASAVVHLEDFVNGSPGRWSLYYRALNHFEGSVAQIYMAYDHSWNALDKKYYGTDDGSLLDRLNKIYNDSRHVAVGAEQLCWITNEGLSSGRASVSFVEFEEHLRAYGRMAIKITGQES